jgi:hypothetical protein
MGVGVTGLPGTLDHGEEGVGEHGRPPRADASSSPGDDSSSAS